MPASLSGVQLIDPQRLYEDCERRGVSTRDWWGRANSFLVPLRHHDGVTYGRGYVLVRPSDYETIRSQSGSLSLTFKDAGGTAATFSPLNLIGIERVSYGADTDAASVYLLTLADRRYRFSQVSVNRAYNVKDDTNTFITSSTNSGTAWTWAGIVSDLWGKLTTAISGFTASAPTFPSAPAGTPEGFYFEGVDCWAALLRVVEAGGYILRFDPTTDTADIVSPATEELAMNSAARSRLIRDTTWHLPTTYPWPENLLVTFPRRGQTSRHTTSVSVGEGGLAGTTEVVWDDMPAVGSPVENTTAIANRAAAVLAVWKWNFLGRFGNCDREFAGVVDYVRQALGTRTWAAWAVYDRGLRGRNGGVISAMLADTQEVDRSARSGLDIAGSPAVWSTTVQGELTPVAQTGGGLKTFSVGTDGSAGVGILGTAEPLFATRNTTGGSGFSHRFIPGSATGVGSLYNNISSHYYSQNLRSASVYGPEYGIPVLSIMSCNTTLGAFGTVESQLPGGLRTVVVSGGPLDPASQFFSPDDYRGAFGVVRRGISEYHVVKTGLDHVLMAGQVATYHGGLLTEVYTSPPASPPPPPVSPPLPPVPPPPPVSPPPPPVSPPISPPVSPPISPPASPSAVPPTVPPADGEGFADVSGLATAVPRVHGRQDITADTVSAGVMTAQRIRLMSPNGTMYDVKVSDLGSLSTAPSSV